MPRNAYPTIASIPHGRSRVYFYDGEGRIGYFSRGLYFWYSYDPDLGGYVASGATRKRGGATSRPIPAEE